MKKYLTLLLTLLIIIPFQGLSAFNIIIEDINEKYGLPKNRVNCMLQDSIGFLWFGMANGLYKFDLNGFTKYNREGKNFSGFPESDVKAIMEIEPGILLVGTQNKGLYIFNTATERYDSMICASSFDFTGISVNSLHKGPDGTIWIGTSAGLIQVRKLKKQKEEFEIIKIFDRENSNLISSEFNDIIESYDGKVWFLTMSDIGFYNSSTRNIESFRAYGANSSIAFLDKDNMLKSCFESGLKIFNTKSFQTKDLIIKGQNNYTQARYVYKDSNSNIWISISNVGLMLLNDAFPKSEAVLISNKNEKYKGLSSNVIYTIYESRDGAIWLCTEEGITMINVKPEIFNSISFGYRHDPKIALGIRALVDSKKGLIWTGTIGDGLKLLNINSGHVTDVALQYQGDKIGKNIQAILSDYHGNIWLGTEGEGVIKFIPDLRAGYTTGKVINYRFNPGALTDHSLTSNYIMCFLEDRHKNIWIGTWQGLSMIDSVELNKSNPYEIVIKHFLHDATDAHSISNSIIMSILEDNEGNIWVGTQSGLNKIIKTERGITFQHPFKNENGELLTDKKILVMHEYIDGKIWFSTQDGGICMLDTKSGFYNEYNSYNGFIDNIVNSIVQDSLGILWLGTNDGLCRFDPSNQTFCIYKKDDGLISSDFYFASQCIIENRLYFGGDKGITYFNPYELKPTSFVFNLVFTDFKLFNKPIAINGKETPIKKHISVLEHLSLKYNQNHITLAFSAINYTHQNELQYECILEGMEDTWINLGSERKITFANLNPGDYKCRVKANIPGLSNNSEEILLSITIHPPFWKTSWAYAIYIVLVIFIVIQTYRFFLNEEKKKHSLVIERMNAKRIHEMDLMKLQFYTNISHELRTPLTLISAPLETIMKEKVEYGKILSYCAIMLKNVQRLKRLIDQLLDLRKIEEGHLKMEWKKGDIIDFIKRIYTNFENYAEKRNMYFTFQTTSSQLYTFFDSDKLDKILFNLISNAFKYTPDFGTISLKLDMKDDLSTPLRGLTNKNLEIELSDSGLGIPKDLISKIFDPFQQVNKNKPIGSAGTGIGLSLTKELVKCHKGRISVESEVDKGSIFTIHFPIFESEPDFESRPNKKNEIASSETDIDKNIEGIEDGKKDEVKITALKPLILFVEDNSELRHFINSELQSIYRIVEAENGQEGLKEAINRIPDLIVSDVMMDKMDGIELCSKLKNDERTSHIPVILLTARHSEEIIHNSYDIGADDYITKPFNVSLLKTRINNLIEQRRKLRKLFGKRVNFDISEVVTNRIDSQFLEKLNKIIEKNIDNPDFDTSSLASDMAMSKMQLYRKMAAITNQTVYSYIRTMRMQKAAKLLLTTDMLIVEVALSVGYTDPSNFTKCFSREFNQSPSNFVKTNRK